MAHCIRFRGDADRQVLPLMLHRDLTTCHGTLLLQLQPQILQRSTCFGTNLPRQSKVYPCNGQAIRIYSIQCPPKPPVLMPSHLALASLHGITACHWVTQVRIEGRSVNCDCFPDLPYLAADTASQAEAGTARQEGNRVAEGARKQPALGQALSLAATAYDCQFSAVLLVACTACMPTLEHISWERCDVKCIRNR